MTGLALESNDKRDEEWSLMAAQSVGVIDDDFSEFNNEIKDSMRCIVKLLR